MQAIQPTSLTTGELTRFSYINSDNVPPSYTAELRKRLEAADDILAMRGSDQNKIALLRKLLA